MTYRTWLAIMSCIVGLGGCADNPRVRTLAGAVGTYASDHQKATDAFKTRFDRYNLQLHDRVVARDAGTEEVTLSTIRQRQRWALAGDRKNNAAFVTSTDVSADAILSRVSAVAAVPAPLDAGNFDAQISVGIAAAADLSKKPSTTEQLRSFLAIASDVYDAVATIREKAASDAPAPAAPDGSAAPKSN